MGAQKLRLAYDFGTARLEPHGRLSSGIQITVDGASDNEVTESVRDFIAANFKNTELGMVRIARNLGLSGLSDDEIVAHCREIILSTPVEEIVVRGKNYYVHSQKHSAILTVNRSSLGIITAKPNAR